MRRDPSLNFEEIPEWRLPFRFFMAAACMGVVTGIGLLLGSAGFSLVLDSRWQLSLIGLLHLFTLGSITMVMIGALFQVTPVMTGEMIKRSPRFLWVFQAMFVVGVLLLAVGLWTYLAPLLIFGALAIFLSLAVFAAKGVRSLFRSQATKPSAQALKFSFIALLVVVVLGGTLLLMHGRLFGLALDRSITNIHMIWALAGWVGVLIAGVSFQVIPMFHVTPEFSELCQHHLPKVVAIGLLVYSAGALMDGAGWLMSLSQWGVTLAFMVYGVEVWQLLQKRKRKLEDVSVSLWKSAVVHFVLFVLVMAGLTLNEMAGGNLWSGYWQEKLKLVAGILLLLGSVWSIVLAMLQKIVPFLAYLHMQRACGTDYSKIKALPHMRELMPIERGRILKYLHWLLVWVLVLTTVFPSLFLLSGIIWVISFLLLAGMIVHVLRMLALHAPYANGSSAR